MSNNIAHGLCSRWFCILIADLKQGVRFLHIPYIYANIYMI